MTKLQAIRWFAEQVLGEKITIARDRYNGSMWGVYVNNAAPRFKIPKKLNIKADCMDKSFRANFVGRCSVARGFSHATLSILHECGHWATRSVMDLTEYKKWASTTHNQEDYMMIPWEHLATDWAVCWLYCPDNRKIARQFERYFFNY